MLSKPFASQLVDNKLGFHCDCIAHKKLCSLDTIQQGLLLLWG